MRAGSTIEAMAAWRKLVGDDRAAVEDLRLVISGRVIRKLCEACKEAYTPDPETLRKLGMNPASAATLYQERRTAMKNDKGEAMPCTFCKELRFNGRFGVYEVLVVDDDIRQAALGGGGPTALKAAFRKQRGKLLQEMAMGAVERGETSVREMVRVLKGDTAAAPAAGAAPAAAPARAPASAPRAAGAPRPAGAPRAAGTPRAPGARPPSA
jgi:type II secretory ATPase GspE/PulE/Tfp pilus assembly ATPase PilB-like protein